MEQSSVLKCLLFLGIVSLGFLIKEGDSKTATIMLPHGMNSFFGSNLPPVCPSEIAYGMNEVECWHHTDCTKDKSCYTDLKCRDTCIYSEHKLQCGENARCQVIEHEPTCVCQSGYEGNATIRCSLIVRLPEPIKQGRCMTHRDCPDHLTCFADWSCRDVCKESNHGLRCGENSECVVENHRPTCSRSQPRNRYLI